jgi:hypothetical protein
MVSGPTKTEGTGIMLDLSAGGCQLESSLTIARCQLLELRAAVPGLESPLMIDGSSCAVGERATHRSDFCSDQKD